MIRACRWLTLACWAGLFVFWLARPIWLVPTLPPAIPLKLLLAGALLFPLRGLLHGRPYTHGWACFLALGYFVLSVDDLAGGLASRPLGWIGLLLSVGFFLGCMGYARLEGRRRKLAAAASAPPAA